MGCGTGSLAIAAKRRVGKQGQVFGIDASRPMIARATSKATTAMIDVSFKTAAAEALPFADATFDAVLSTLMLHHLPRQVRRQCLNEIQRVLKHQGRVFVVDFGKPQERSGLLAHFHRHGHVDPREMVALLNDAGFHAIAQGAFGISSLQYVLAKAAT